MTRFLLRTLAILLLVPMLLGFIQAVFFFSLMTHFRLQLSLAAAVVLTLSAWRREPWAVAAAGLTLVLGAFTLVPYYLPVERPRHTHSFRLYAANILGPNHNYEAIQASIRAADADVVTLMEVQDHHVKAIKELEEYPFQLVEPHARDFFGMAVLSKIPVTDHEIFGAPNVPNVRVQVQVGQSQVEIYTTHPFPPISRRADGFGFDTLNRVAQRLDQPEKTVVTGDLNATGWGRRTRLLRDLGLIEARRGFGYQPTWPAQMPLLYIPIDHVLVSPDLSVYSFKTLKSVGSDHLPMLTEIGVPQ